MRKEEPIKKSKLKGIRFTPKMLESIQRRALKKGISATDVVRMDVVEGNRREEEQCSDLKSN
jgi:hypothetical protein